MDIDVMNKISYGLFVLTAKDGEKDCGCVINTAMQVTVNPNRILITVNKDSYTHDAILKNKEFNLSILDESSQFAIYKNFGLCFNCIDYFKYFFPALFVIGLGRKVWLKADFKISFNRRDSPVVSS